MMIDIVSLVIGFFVGMIVLGIAIEVGMKRSERQDASSRHTKTWNISEISNPRIMAEYLGDVELPNNSKVIVNRFKDKTMLAGLNVKKNSDVKGNFIIGDDRVLILAGPVKKDEVGIWTVEKEIVDQLKNDFDEMWKQGSKMDFEE